MSTSEISSAYAEPLITSFITIFERLLGEGKLTSFTFESVIECLRDDKALAKDFKREVLKKLSQNGRTLSDVLLKTIITNATVLPIIGHLTSLRRLPAPLAAWSVWNFVLFPLHPLSELLADSYRSIISRHFSKGKYAGCRGSFKYHLAASLGARALKEGKDHDSAKYLLLVDPHQVECKYCPRDLKWLGRVCLLLAFLIQASSAMMLGFRRLLHSRALTGVKALAEIFNGSR